MTCEETRERFSALLDEALTGPERARCEAHLAECPECVLEWVRFRKTLGLLGALTAPRAPGGFVDRVLMVTRPAASWHHRLWRGLLVPIPIKLPIELATVALLVVTAALLFRQPPEIEKGAPPRVAEERRTGVMRVEERTAAPSVAMKDTDKSAAPPERPGTARSEADAGRPRLEGETRSAKSVGERQPERLWLSDKPAYSRSGSAGRPPPQRQFTMARETLQPKDAPHAPGSGDVVGKLSVHDRAAAEQALAELVARLGGTQAGRGVDTEGEVVEIRLSRAAYPAFVHGLAGIGRWVPESESAELAAEIRVTLRITP
jgi:hypothetical protein